MFPINQCFPSYAEFTRGTCSSSTGTLWGHRLAGIIPLTVVEQGIFNSIDRALKNELVSALFSIRTFKRSYLMVGFIRIGKKLSAAVIVSHNTSQKGPPAVAYAR